VILVLALIVLGPDKLPSAARQAGKYLSEFRRMSEGFQRELRDAMDFDATKPQSGTMAPVKTTDVADVSEVDPTKAEKTAEGEPVGEAHRVIDSANGPTLPPVMRPTVIPDTPVPPANGSSPAEGNAVSPPAAATSPTVEVDGPSASFD